MTDLNLDTSVRLTIKQILIAIVALFAGAWALLAVTTSGLRDDVSHIRAALSSLQKSDKDGALKVRDAELGMTKEIAGLRVVIEKIDARLELLNGQMTGVGKNLAMLEG